MPIFEFQCKKCEEVYEELVASEKKCKGVACPKCKSKSKTRLISTGAFNFANPIGTDRWVSDSKGHDYRYNWNKPNVRKQREFAEKHSHMGPKPYGE